MCSISCTYPKAKGAANSHLNTSQRIGRADRSVSTIGIDQYKGSYLFKKYRITLTHTLEKQLLINYTYVWRKIGYLSFLKLLVIVNSSDQQATTFDIVKRRLMD